MADLTYGELANMTYAELANTTYALDSSGGGGETSCVWTAEKVSEIMAELDSLTAEVAALKTQMTSLSTALTNAVSTLKSYGDTNWRTATGFATPEDVQLTTTTQTVQVTTQETDLSEVLSKMDTLATPDDLQVTTQTVDLSEVAKADQADVLQALAEKIFALIANWSLSGTTLTVRDESGTTIFTKTVTKDSDGNIIEVC